MLATYQTPQQYLEATQTFLEARELENNLILGLCNGFADKTAIPPNCVFINVFDGENIRATSIKTLNKAIVAGATTDAGFIKPLADYYQQQNIQLDGVFGEPFYADAFAMHYAEEYATQMTLIVHQLDAVNPLPLPHGQFEIATEADTGQIVEWSIAFEADARSTIKKTLAETFKYVQTKIASGNIYKWVHHGQMVSMAAVVRQTSNVGILGFVYTPPQFRGKGYATAVVQKLSEHLLANGFKHCGLFTDKANPTSNHIYYKIGYRQVAEFADIGFR